MKYFCGLTVRESIGGHEVVEAGGARAVAHHRHAALVPCNREGLPLEFLNFHIDLVLQKINQRSCTITEKTNGLSLISILSL